MNLTCHVIGSLCTRMHSPIHPLAVKHNQRGIGSRRLCLTGGSGPARVWGHDKSRYSAEEMLKASVSNEGRINVLLWYRLVGAHVGLLPGFAPGVSGCTWYRGDSPT